MKNGKVMRGEEVRNYKGEGAVDSNSQNQANFFSNEKEIKLCKNRKRKREKK